MPRTAQRSYTVGVNLRSLFMRKSPILLAPVLLVAAGCGSGNAGGNTQAALNLTPGSAFIDTNCTGCNATNAAGGSVEQFRATMPDGEPAPVRWFVSGGDSAGAGSISDDGQYTPPGYLLHDRIQVVVTAVLEADPRVTATSVLTVMPGFSAPLTPENVALGANGSVTITGVVAEAGGSAGIHFALSNSTNSVSGGEGSLSATNCQHGAHSFTTCSVIYTAPQTVEATAATYVVATVEDSGAREFPTARTSSTILLNVEGVTSNPAAHQTEQLSSALLGSSGGNSGDYDTSGNTVADCCGGTLGALLKGSDNNLYLLSNNHVLAHSDHAAPGDAIVQPGLIDNNCNPSGAGTETVGTLSAWPPLSSRATNVDAAIAQAVPGAVDAGGAILELGAKQPDGTLGAAPPGISSTGGKGEAALLNLRIAKSGRTTGLTCAAISAVDLDVSVDYFQDCAETRPYLTKLYTNQFAMSGNGFSDAGDSGSLIVDAANAEPVGLFFAGGRDSAGVSYGVASPATEVLNELDAHGDGVTYTFQGGADHGVSCLSYGDATIAAAQARMLTDAENARGLQALSQARTLVNAAAGILGVALGKSDDRAGEAAVILYTDENKVVDVPPAVDGVRTMAIATNAHAVSVGSAPVTPGWEPLAAAQLKQAEAAKQQVVRTLMRDNAGFFAVGVGQSLDNPKDAALVIYVDRRKTPAVLPQFVNGLRTRYIFMDRLHVTRSYSMPEQAAHHCGPHPASEEFNPAERIKPLELQ